MVEQKQGAIGAWLSQADSDVAAALSPAHPERVVEAREDLRHLLASHPQTARASQLMRGSEGRLFVTGQDAVVDTLLTVAEEGEAEEGKLALAAVRTGSPLLKNMVGGQQVIDEMVRRVAERVAGPALERKASLESLANVLRSNAASSRAHILELTGVGAVHVEDPIAERALGA